jgi:cytochrome c oxidase subunit 4
MSAVAHAADAHEHIHPGPATYFKIAITLFILTALEVGAYEVAHTSTGAGGILGTVATLVVPIILILSAFKFALVAMFYMHLKMDGKLLSGVFIFSLLLASVMIVALMVIFSYLWAHSPTVNPLK